MMPLGCLSNLFQLKLTNFEKPIVISNKHFEIFLLANGGFLHLLFITAPLGSPLTEELDAAFSNYRMYESLELIIAFANSIFLCISV